MTYSKLAQAIGAASLLTMGGCGLTDVMDEIPLPDVRFDSQSYVVQPGDTIEMIATRYQLDPNMLASINGVGDGPLQPSSILTLDRSATSVVVANTADGDYQPVATPIARQTATIVRPTDALLDDPTLAASTMLQTTVNEAGQIVSQLPQPERIDSVQAGVAVEQVAVISRPEGKETIIAEVRADYPSQGVQESDTIPADVRKMTAEPAEGGWNWPTVGKVVKEFDLAEVNRQGVDIDAGPGAGVQAAADGEVVYSGKDLASYGNLVILRHKDNYLSAYSKVNDIIVKENQKVKAGDVIAILGSDQTQGTELHFEIRHNGEPVNPVDYLPTL